MTICFEVDCERPGHLVRLPAPCNRPDAVSSYCDEHGGRGRAEAEARRDWMLLAPPEVGGEEEVMRAGSAGLDTTHAYVVVRPLWLAWLGLGSHQIQVHHGTPSRRQRGGRRNRHRIGRQGTASFPTRDAAIEEATAQWRARVAARVEEVRKMRGGTLAWGVPIEPLEAPVVVDVAEGENSWDAALLLPRRGRPGQSAVSGIRPSGEAP